MIRDRAGLKGASGMTPERLRACMEKLYWGPKDLAIAIEYYSLRPVERWLAGEEPVPVPVAEAVERMVGRVPG